MTLIQLEYIIAVDTYKSFSLAAEKCFVTQPTLSMQIQKLEEQLGVMIFDRSRQPVVPTETGNEIIEQARKVTSEASVIKEIIKEKKGEIEGVLRLGVIPTVAPYLLPLFLTKFLSKYPNVRLIVNELTTEQILSHLKNDTLDAGLLATPLNDVNTYETPLFYEPFVAYVSSESVLYKKKKLKPRDLDANEMWLMSEGHCFHSQVLNLCYEQKKREDGPNLEYRAGSIETLKRIVELNKGITLLPYLAIKDKTGINSKMIRQFESPEPVREISLITHRNFVKKKLLEVLKNEIIATIPPEIKKAQGKKVVSIQ